MPCARAGSIATGWSRWARRKSLGPRLREWRRVNLRSNRHSERTAPVQIESFPLGPLSWFRTGRIEEMAGASQLIQIELGPPVRRPSRSGCGPRLPSAIIFTSLKSWRAGWDCTRCASRRSVRTSASAGITRPRPSCCWAISALGAADSAPCPKGRPEPIDWDEPRRVAEAVATLGLKHAVVTSVNRDDDNVGGARVFAETIREIRELIPDCRIEVLIPDFQGLEEPLKIVLDAQPDVLNHNTETVPRLYRAVRSGARYERTLNLLENAKKFSPGMVTKSGVMVGLGESTQRTGRGIPRPGLRAGSTFLPWGNICVPRAIICRSPASTRRKNSASCGMRHCASASAMLNPVPWCDPAITRTSRLNQHPASRR